MSCAPSTKTTQTSHWPSCTTVVQTGDTSKPPSSRLWQNSAVHQQCHHADKAPQPHCKPSLLTSNTLEPFCSRVNQLEVVLGKTAIPSCLRLFLQTHKPQGEISGMRMCCRLPNSHTMTSDSGIPRPLCPPTACFRPRPPAPHPRTMPLISTVGPGTS